MLEDDKGIFPSCNCSACITTHRVTNLITLSCIVCVMEGGKNELLKQVSFYWGAKASDEKPSLFIPPYQLNGLKSGVNL